VRQRWSRSELADRRMSQVAARPAALVAAPALRARCDRLAGAAILLGQHCFEAGRAVLCFD
jgi:hypothetical protein